jgi:hypothetical protein
VTFEQQLRADPPPAFLEAFDVELYGLTHGSFGPEQFPGRRLMSFTFKQTGRPARVWFRWEDADGDRFYLEDEFRHRSGAPG